MNKQTKWYAIWSAWLLIVMASFGVLEGIAIGTGGVTLSRYTWDLYEGWPLIAVIYGMVFGGLAVHFFWHWSPPGSKNQG
jgi:hypothetical protein